MQARQHAGRDQGARQVAESLAEKFWPITSLMYALMCRRRTSTMRPSSSTHWNRSPSRSFFQLATSPGHAAVAQLAHLHLAGLAPVLEVDVSPCTLACPPLQVAIPNDPFSLAYTWLPGA